MRVEVIEKRRCADGMSVKVRPLVFEVPEAEHAGMNYSVRA